MEQQTSKNDITLTVSQQLVLDKLIQFIDSDKSRVFILRGYAGTGKTTLMRFLIEQLESQKRHYQLLASTGRAAKVLGNLSGGNNASTIHSMIYSYKGLNKDLSDKEVINADETGQLLLVFEQNEVDAETQPTCIYIADEASMISDVASKDVTQAQFGSGRLLTELLRYDQRRESKYIFVGDPCQLPPIEQSYSPALITEYFLREFGIHAEEATLTEIMRQEGTSTLVKASQLIRAMYAKAPESDVVYGRQNVWGYLPFSQCRDIRCVASKETLMKEYAGRILRDGFESAVCICRSNKSCGVISAQVRRMMGHLTGRVEQGDLLQVVQNNSTTGLVNGDFVTVEHIGSDVRHQAGFTFVPVKVKELFSKRVYSTLILEDVLYMGRLNLDGVQQTRLFVDFIQRMKRKGIKQKQKSAFEKAMRDDPYLNALRCVWGYAVTCHKAQGGEWEDVFMDVPRNITINPTKATWQWIYTAMTRARKTLHLVDDFYVK